MQRTTILQVLCLARVNKGAVVITEDLQVVQRLPDSLESGSGNLTGADYAVGGAFGNNHKILVIAIKHKARTTREGLQITTDLFTGPRQ